jgi:hypothetical protein
LQGGAAGDAEGTQAVARDIAEAIESELVQRGVADQPGGDAGGKGAAQLAEGVLGLGYKCLTAYSMRFLGHF